MRSATRLHDDGVAAINAGRLARARQLLEQARSATDDPDLSARIETSLAYVESETGDRDTALGWCDAALARPGLAPPTRAAVHGQRGLLHMLAGRNAEAIADLSASITRDAASEVIGRGYLNRGGVYLQQNDIAAASRDFQAAREPLVAAGADVEAAMADHNLGYSLMLAGDLVGALAAMDRARPVLAPLSAVSEATCDQDRAEVLLAAGLVDEGTTELAASARAYGSRRLRRRQAEAELALARARLDLAPELARTTARAAARHFQAAGTHAMATRARAIALAAELELGRLGPGALGRAELLAAELDEQDMRWSATMLRLHATAAATRRQLSGRAPAPGAPPRPGPGAPLVVRLLDRDVRAELAAASGRRASALQHLRAGLDDLHAWQSSFGSLDLQTGVAGRGVRLAARGLALAVGSGRPEVLLEWSERARMLASRVQPVQAPEDEQIVADLAELRAIAAEGGPRDAGREAALRQRVRERAWQHRGSGEVADPVTLDGLRSGLGDGTALTAYVVADGRLVALVVTAADVTWVDLGDRGPLDALLGGLLPDLDVAGSDLPEPMAGFVRAELAARLAAIADLLVGPVLGTVGDRAVVLTPSGVLAGVPWTLLPGFTGRPVTVAQSATSWLARRATPLRTATAGFVAGPRVARAEDEVTAAAKEWDGARVLTGSDATAAGVSGLAGSVDVLHVAAHGRHSAENPLFSGLQLADGPWFGYDVDRLRQVPDVVLLSACEVGRSTVRWGDELLGMTTAWLHAGARCVVASPAAVNDAAAYDVLVAVHERLASGEEPAVALAAAVPAVSAGTAPVPLTCYG
ncbi:CHAT domain-containing protein [Nocardioides sp.]|uniref:CHAT domain-containing protein n=1 Tax=Nocardioides sp. TaxID=35761 RepID=UPI0037851F9C